MRTFIGAGYRIRRNDNPRTIYRFVDGSLIQFNRGQFDDYRVTYFPQERDMGYGFSPKDEDYFADLLELRDIVGYNVIWNDFNSIATLVQTNGILHNGKPDYSLETINRVRYDLNDMVTRYPVEYQEESFKLFMTLWSVMVSEWYHSYGERPSILKHTPKIIGAYQVLRDLYTPRDAAIFSKMDEMINGVLLAHNPNFNLAYNKSTKLKFIMDIYGIDRDWLG
ncbi:DUF7004 family protein [Streptococcus constellatus]|uniref:DUF7004 family protein n=1 Tax=Streptococcus constellatus TaxID=76860 RepID=UPI00398239F0